MEGVRHMRLQTIRALFKYFCILLDNLSTTALRPTLTYGECDLHFVPQVLEFLSRRGYTYPRIAGAGGKQQIVYAG